MSEARAAAGNGAAGKKAAGNRAAGNEAFDRIEGALRAFCMGYPEAYEDHPWGETVYKVKGKVFVFMGQWQGTFGVTTKLPVSGAVALMLPFSEPTGYGLGKSGWVSARFRPGDDVPLEMLQAWIDESYRAVAPKKLAASLPAQGTPSAPSPAPAAAAKTRTRPEAAKAAAKAKPAATAKPAAKAEAKPAATTKPAAKAAAKPKAKPAATAKPAPNAKAKPASRAGSTAKRGASRRSGVSG